MPFGTILALKPIEKKRRYDINFMLEDEGLALFTGSDTVPCSSSLHSFDYGMKEATLREMKTIYIEILKKYVDLSVLHIDFHTTPILAIQEKWRQTISQRAERT
jgi:hypothetical protein